jgi:hypothetical protein
VVNPQGVMQDAVCREHPEEKWRARDPLVVDVGGYNSEWKAAVHILSDAWTAEFSVPWKDLDMKPQPGLQILLNLGRFRSQGLNWERTYWAPVLEMQGDTFERLDADLFGTVRLR